MSKIPRQEAMQKWTEFKELYNSKTDDVTTKDTLYFGFASRYETTVGSDGFDGCFGVIITNSQGCIVSHMTATEESVSDAEREIAQYYNTYQAIFTNNVCNAYIYGQVSFSDPDQLIYPGLYNRLDQFVQSTTGVAPMLAKYIEPAEACYDSEGNPLQGFDSIKSPPGSLVIKCNKDGSSLPIVQFITPDIQYHAACV